MKTIDKLQTISSPETYFTSLTLENVRCFGERQTLSLVDDNRDPARWTLILGENGIGKTTLLQCLARMRPVAYVETSDSKPVEIVPEFNSEESNDVLDRLIRYGRNVNLLLEAEFLNCAVLSQPNRITKSLKTSMTLERTDGVFGKAKSSGSSNIYLETEPYILGYGATRQMGSLNLDKTELLNPAGSLFDTHLQLYDAELILRELDYRALKNPEDAEPFLIKLKTLIADILPDLEGPSDIEILRPKSIVTSEGESNISFRTPYGNVRLPQISLGYQTALAWATDLGWRMSERYPDSNDPMFEPAIVLIDEIDLHLHPRWQRTFKDTLTKYFPNVQFICTAHSPLMAQAALDENLAVLLRDEDHVVIKNDPDIVRGWRVDQIATSELFGLGSSRSPEIEKLFNERDQLLDKPERNQEEEQRLRDIEMDLDPLPTAVDPKDQEALDIIRRAATLIKEKA